MRRPPEHVLEAHDHPAHRMLALLDPRLELRWNAKLSRFEVWGRDWIMDQPVWAFVERVVEPERGGYAEPGEWLINKLRARDPAHNPDIEGIVKQVAGEIDAHNARLEAERERRHREEREALVDETYRPIRRALMDDMLGEHPTSDVPFVVPENYPGGTNEPSGSPTGPSSPQEASS